MHPNDRKIISVILLIFLALFLVYSLSGCLPVSDSQAERLNCQEIAERASVAWIYNAAEGCYIQSKAGAWQYVEVGRE